MGNVVCVGIGQFLAPIVLAVAFCAIVGAILSATGRSFAKASRERQRVRAYEEAQRARLGKDWRKALKKEELARLKREIEFRRGILSFDAQRYRQELTTANSECNWGWTTEEIEARSAAAARNYNGYAPFYRADLERLERQATAIKI